MNGISMLTSITRKFRAKKLYNPCPADEGDEIYPNGIFHFNISRIVEDIESGKLQVELEKIDVPHWFKNHCMGDVNKDHMPNVVLSKPVIQAEIKAGFFEIIDGRHRMEKALRENMQYMDSYKLKGEQLLDYFIDERGYRAFIDYWNDWLKNGY